MSDTIKLNTEKENTLTFQVNISGIETDDVKVRFAIDTNDVCYMFPCTKVNDEDYKVTIPVLKITQDTYDCMIEVIANEFFFVAMNGKVKIVGTPKIKAKIKKEGVEDDEDSDSPIKIKASTIKVEQLDEGKKHKVKPEEVKEEDDEQADPSVGQAEEDDALTVQTDQAAVTSESKDAKIKRILGELGYVYEPVKPLGRSLKSYLSE